MAPDSLVLEQLAWTPLQGAGGLVAAVREAPALRERLDALATQPRLSAAVRARIIRAIAADSPGPLTAADACTVERLLLGAGETTGELRETLDSVGTSLRWNLAKLATLQLASDRTAQERVLGHLASSDEAAVAVYADFENVLCKDVLGESVAHPGMLSAVKALSKRPVVVCSGRPHAAAEKRMHKFLSQALGLCEFSTLYPSAGEAVHIAELFAPSDLHRGVLYPKEQVIYVGGDLSLARRLKADRKLVVAFILTEGGLVEEDELFVPVSNAVQLAVEATKRGLIEPGRVSDVVTAARRELLRARRSILAREEFVDRTKRLEDLEKKIRADIELAVSLFGGSAETPAKSDLEIRRVDVTSALVLSPPQSLEDTRVPSESEEIAEIRNFTFLSAFP